MAIPTRRESTTSIGSPLAPAPGRRRRLALHHRFGGLGDHEGCPVQDVPVPRIVPLRANVEGLVGVDGVVAHHGRPNPKVARDAAYLVAELAPLHRAHPLVHLVVTHFLDPALTGPLGVGVLDDAGTGAEHGPNHGAV